MRLLWSTMVRALAHFKNRKRPSASPAENWKPLETLDQPRADFHLAVAEAHRKLGESEASALNYRQALIFDPASAEAHYGLARQRMPGDGYLVWLERLYASVKPGAVIEIGIFEGASLALLRRPTIAIGVDPTPNVVFPLKVKAHIFAETSDEFFARERPGRLLAGQALTVGFIDGLHLFEQALSDFINLEAYCGPHSIILLHDTFPLDESTQTRIRRTHFHTGDVWKVIPCLKHYRPELDIFTIATPPSGLTVVAGLNPVSRVLKNRYDEAVARFIDTSFSSVEDSIDTALNVVPNDWSAVEARLKARQII